MKVKNLSKVLAFMVAVVMIFAALPIMANADNAADAFVVSYGAPAIPMDVNTKVDLKTLAVEITKGTTVSGADCEWATDVADGIVLDANKKTVEALEKGNYKLTATTAGVTKNVWVIVKAVEETDFYLVNFESLNKDTFNPDDWRGIAAEIGGPIPDISKTVLEDDYIRTPGTNGASYVYIDDIFLDFADYTVTATMSQNSTKNTKIHDYEAYGAGLIGRAHITSDNKYESGIFTSIKQTLGAVLFYPYKVENGITSQRHYGSLIKDSSNNGFKFGQVPAEYAPTGYVWDSINDYHDVKYVFNGQKADMYLEEFHVNELFRVSSFDKNQTQAGYPGFCTYRSYANVKSFAVQLNSNAMPAVMTEEPAPEAD
ncbi:MAG: hypothetical protein J6S00_04025, partial [Clostridia bacterium]|nr:hypothetical protein [Clostridia bacterium]